MADNNPNIPGGGLPPKPGDASKVQPKKETVRISLPPKPSATATIKLPSMPAGLGPSAPVAPGAPLPPASVAPPTPAPVSVPMPPRPPTSSATPAPAAPRPPTSMGAPAPKPPGAAPRPPAPMPVVKKISGLDVGLAVAAAVVGLGAVVSVYLLKSLQ